MANNQKQKVEKNINHSSSESALEKFNLAFEYDRTWSEARDSLRQSSKN